MPFFNYNAVDKKLHHLSGLVEAPNEGFAAKLLRERGLFIVSIRVYSMPLSQRITAKFSHVGFSEIVTFTRQLSTMINAGLPLTESLKILDEQAANPALKKVVADFLHQIEGGSSFSSAIAKYPQYFSPIYRSLIQAGEAAGMLDNVLLRLADNLEKEKEFRGKIRGALIYPTIIVIGMGMLMLVMVVFVFPRLTDLYKDLGAETPITMRAMVALSNLLINFWWAGILLMIALFFAFGRFKQTQLGIRVLDYIALHLPIFGALQKKVIMVEFTRTAGILIGAGVPLLDVLTIVSKSMDSYQFQEALRRAKTKVEKGLNLGNAISIEATFPRIVPQMIMVGEATGKLDEILGKLSRFFEVEVDQATKALTTSLEPLIMIVLGIGVGFMVWSVIIPIYGLTNKFQ